MNRLLKNLRFMPFILVAFCCNAQGGYAILDEDGILHSLVSTRGKADKITQYSSTEFGLDQTDKFTYVPNANSDLFPLKWDRFKSAYTLLSNECFLNRFGPSVFHNFDVETQDSLSTTRRKINIIDSLIKVHGSRSQAIAIMGLPQAIRKKDMLFFPFKRNYRRYDRSSKKGDILSWAYDFEYRRYPSQDSIVAIFRTPEVLQKWMLSEKKPSAGKLAFETNPVVEGSGALLGDYNVVDSAFYEGDIYLHSSKGLDILLNLNSGYLYDVTKSAKMIGRIKQNEKSQIILLKDLKRNVLWVNYPVRWTDSKRDYNIEYYQVNKMIIPIIEFMKGKVGIN